MEANPIQVTLFTGEAGSPRRRTTNTDNILCLAQQVHNQVTNYLYCFFKIILFHRSSTIDMDCSILYGTEYPVLWMKIGVGTQLIHIVSHTHTHHPVSKYSYPHLFPIPFPIHIYVFPLFPLQCTYPFPLPYSFTSTAIAVSSNNVQGRLICERNNHRTCRPSESFYHEYTGRQQANTSLLRILAHHQR